MTRLTSQMIWTNIQVLHENLPTVHLRHSMYIHCLKLIIPGLYNLIISSFKLVPPVVTMTCRPLRCLPSSLHICDVCRASSLVGTNTSAITPSNITLQSNTKSVLLL